MAVPNEALAWRALALLELRLSNYRYPPGMRLSADRLAVETGIGRTPVRAALQWLHRDGVIGHAARIGYFVKPPSVGDYRSLYAGARALAIGSFPKGTNGAARWRVRALAEGEDGGEAEAEPRPYAAAAEELFNRIAAMSGSDVVIRAMGVVNLRLRFARTIEPALVKGAHDEISRMSHLLDEADGARLKRAVEAYHARRLAVIGALVDAASAKALRDSRQEA